MLCVAGSAAARVQQLVGIEWTVRTVGDALQWRWASEHVSIRGEFYRHLSKCMSLNQHPVCALRDPPREDNAQPPDRKPQLIHCYHEAGRAELSYFGQITISRG